MLAFDDRRVREAAAAAPYDVMEIVVNGRTYGGGGIFNLYATVASDNAYTPYVFVHEFGHHFAGLADEYYTSDVAYGAAAARPEPWEPNATANAASPKWRDLVTPGTPLPTPWSKAEFEAAQKEIQARRRKIRAEKRPEEEMEALFREEQQRVDALLAQGPHARAVGAFEGALYEAAGYFRAEANCIMFTRHTRVLRRVPARDRARDRPLRRAIAALRAFARPRGIILPCRRRTGSLHASPRPRSPWPRWGSQGSPPPRSPRAASRAPCSWSRRRPARRAATPPARRRASCC